VLVSERIEEDHVLDRFDSGKPPLDRWLRGSALEQTRRRLSSTFVWCDTDRQVVGFFTLSAHALARDRLPSRVGRGGPAMVPAILLARLALDRSLHGSGLGAELLVDALRRSLAATEAGPGARLVVVDALDAEAQKFYEHVGFRPLSAGGSRLYRTMSAIAADLDPDPA